MTVKDDFAVYCTDGDVPVNLCLSQPVYHIPVVFYKAKLLLLLVEVSMGLNLTAWPGPVY